MSYRYRAYPALQQVEVLTVHCGQARFVWNLAVYQQSLFRTGGRVSPPPNSAARFRQLAQARQDNDWLAAGSSSVQQAALRDYDQAVRNWLGHKSHRQPTWRRKGLHEGFCIRDVNVQQVNRRWARVQVPKLGWLRFRLSRPLPKKYGHARVTLDRAGRWHVSFTAAQAAVNRAATTGKTTGVDRGVATTLALSDGQHYHVPYSAKADAKARKLAAKLARQRKGSKRRDQTKHQLAKAYAQAADKRKDWVEKTTTRLVQAHDLVVIEDLGVKHMVRKPKPKPDPDQAGAFLPNRRRAKAGLNKSIHRSMWGLFAQRLEAKAEATEGIQVLRVHPAHTSLQCRACNHTSEQNRQSQAVFSCARCGHTNHADTHAAQNILQRGIALLSPPGGGQDPQGPARTNPKSPKRGLVARTPRTPVAA